MIVMDPSDMINDGKKGQSTLLMSWNCYCLKHGYRLLYAPKVPMTNIAMESGTDTFRNRANQKGFYQGRLLLWCHYLRLTDILFVVDSDSVVINHEKKLTDFISSPDDHVALQQRQNTGICAGAMIIRNSPQGQAWLDMWYEDDTPHIDMDNGRLHSQVLKHFLGQQYASEVNQSIAWRKSSVIEKLHAADARGRSDVTAYLDFARLMADHIGYSRHVTRFGGVVVYPAFGGFFRDFGFESQPGLSFWNEVPFNCVLDSDFILHSKTSGPLVEKEDWTCSQKGNRTFGSSFPTCSITSQLWYQCQMTRHDRAGLFGSNICQKSRDGPCSLSATNLDEWRRVCSGHLDLVSLRA